MSRHEANLGFSTLDLIGQTNRADLLSAVATLWSPDQYPYSLWDFAGC